MYEYTGYGERRVITQITFIPRVPQCLSSRPNWDPHLPSPARECVTHPRTKRGMGHSPAGEGVRGGPQFELLEKSLALCLLCGCVTTPSGWLCSTGGCPRLRWCGEERRPVLCMLDYLEGSYRVRAVLTSASKSRLLHCPSRQHNFDVILSKDSFLPLLGNSSVFLPSIIKRMLHCEGFCHGVLQFS
jgi:hypothetical protein